MVTATLSFIRPSYHNGFAPRDSESRYPELWKGCVAAWAPCLGPTGLNVFGQAGRRDPAVLTDMPPASQWVIDGGQYALLLDGGTSNDRLVVADSSYLDLTDHFAIAMWFRSATTSQSSKYLLDKNNRYAFLYRWGGGNDFEFFASGYTGDDPRTGSSIPVTDTLWHHVVYSYSGTTWEGFLDGKRIFSLSKTFTLATTPTAFIVGAHNPKANETNGYFDDIRIYKDHHLSSADVRLLATRRGIAYELADHIIVSISVATGLLIPVVMHSYRQRRV